MLASPCSYPCQLVSNVSRNVIILHHQPPGLVANFASKWCQLVAIFSTNASGATWWPILQAVQLAAPGSQILAQAV